jgi:hypothetical protein
MQLYLLSFVRIYGVTGDLLITGQFQLLCHILFNPLTPDLNPSAQRCLTIFLLGILHFVNICLRLITLNIKEKNVSLSQLYIYFLIQCHHMSLMDFVVSLPVVAQV